VRAADADKEWGFSNRMANIAAALGKLIGAVTDFRTLDDVDVPGKRVLLRRIDLNEPMANGAVSDTTRIERLENP
jgi:hypothetical protein